MIIFLYGEDTFRSRQKLKELKDKFIKEVDPSGNSLVTVEGEMATLEKINQVVSPTSLFSRRSMIVIESIFLNKSQNIYSQILEYFKTRKDKDVADNIIIFWDGIGSGEKLTKAKDDLFKFFVKQKYTLPEFKILSSIETANWAKKETERRGGKISQTGVLALSALLGGDLWQISQEIDKLINYKSSQHFNIKTSEIIEQGDIEKMVRGKFDENIFALTDAISVKNKSLAVKLFEEQIEAGLTDFYLLNMITRQIRVLLQIRQALDSGFTPKKIASTLKIHPFIVQKGINQVRNFQLNILKKIFNELVEIDYLMKTGQGDVKTGLSLLIAKL